MQHVPIQRCMTLTCETSCTFSLGRFLATQNHEGGNRPCGDREDHVENHHTSFHEEAVDVCMRSMPSKRMAVPSQVPLQGGGGGEERYL